MRNCRTLGVVIRILSVALGILLLQVPTSFGQNPSFVYVANVNSSNVSGFAIDPATGSLAYVPGSPFPLINFAGGVAISPSNSFLYASASTQINVFSIDQVTGHLTGQGAPVSQGFGVGPLVFHPSGNFAYSTDNPISGGVGTIFAYSVNKTTGALAPIGSPLATGSQPQMVAITPNGNYLYVANRFSSDISAYAIDGLSGTLTPVVGSRFALGILPHGLTVDPTGQFLYVAAGESLALTGYNINNTNGVLTQITGSPFLGGNRGPTSIAVDPTGKFAYAGNSADGTVSAFSIGANGTLVPLPNSPFSTTSIPHFTSLSSVVVDSLGKFLYVADFTTSTVYEFQIDPVSGALTQLASSPISTGGANPVSIVISRGPSISASIVISFVRPDQGGDTGLATTTLTGSGFVGGATLRLRKAGEAEIVADAVEVSGAGTKCVGTFNLLGKTRGAWDVVLTNPDGTFATLAGAFTVVAGTGPQIWVDLIGPNKIRTGRIQNYFLLVGNSGNVDGTPGMVSVSVPSAVQYDQMLGDGLFVAGRTTSPEFGIPAPSNANDQHLLFATSGVVAGTTQSVAIPINVPSSSTFTLKSAWQDDLASMSIDDFLGFEQIPFISFPATGCSPCLNQYASETLAWLNVTNAYEALQNAKANEVNEIVKLSTDAGLTIIGVSGAELLGLSSLGTVSLGAATATIGVCVKNLIDDKNCVSGLRPILVELGKGINGCLSGTPPQTGPSCLQQLHATALPVPLAEKLQILLGVVNDMIITIDLFVTTQDLIGTEAAAFGKLQQALGPYSVARAAYQACLGSTHCTVPPVPTPPPTPPGTSSLSVQALQSYDPNDKVGNHGAGAQQFISGRVPSSYAVYFANQETATAPAQQVTITDQLDISHNDLMTFNFGAISFASQLVFPPPLQTDFSTTVDLRPATNLLVGVHASLNSSTGFLSWNLQSLDPSTNQPPVDPTAGFLPPGAEGSVFFSVVPKPVLPTNTQVANQASIVFDTNAPINTPTWINTIDKTSPVSHILSLPATSSSSGLTVQWTGTDVGAGIQDFTIYVSDNGGPFAPFLMNTAGTSATFSGQSGHVYAFYSVARDLVGNVEATKNVAEASTQIAATFSAFSATLEISRKGSFELNGRFVLATNSDGINPVAEAFALQLGPLSEIIPAGSFARNRRGNFVFEGVINGVKLNVRIAPLGNNSFTLKVEGRGVDLTGLSSPAIVSLTVGNDTGMTTVRAELD